ncbi:MAG: hypothetical protein IJW40_07010 [Clostridia bacterium]|nr:hypothetical protein [Clostridia bacterium]
MNAPLSPRREAWQRLVGGIFFRIFILLLILYTVYHCVIAATPRMTTAVVNLGEESIVTEGTATIFRDETVLSTPMLRTDGQEVLISYPLENGAKVSANSTLVTLYTTTLDAQSLALLQTQLHTLDRAIVASARAERQYPYTTAALTTASLGRVHDDIRSHILSLTRAASEGAMYTELVSLQSELALSLNVYATLTAANTGKVTPTEALEAQRSALLATVARSARTLTLQELMTGENGGEGMTSFSGYFYHADAVDGFERVFSRESLVTMNIVDYDAMLATPRNEYAAGVLLGKAVGSYTWSITLPVAFDLADTLTIGDTYSVRFPEEDVTLTMTLDRVIRSVGDGRAVLVLSADVMPTTFRFTRHQTAQLVTRTVQGYRIPDTALQTVEGEECVYVLQDGSVQLREITVLLRGNGYVIVAIPGEDEARGLSLHDVVITSGENLYDGKYID